MAQRLRILLVEDEPTPRKLAARILNDDYEVTAAASAEEALALLELDASAFSILVTDNEMPGMTGVELLTQVMSRYPTIRCLMVSGNITEERRRWLTMHRVPFLEKPYRLQALLEAVNKCCEIS